MKRTPLKRIGRVGEANLEARRRIAVIAEGKGLNYCELKLLGCTRNWPLAPAHRHKRSFYKGDAALLSDYRQWVAACVNCHDQIEHNPQLTEDHFMRLRGVE